MSAFALRIISHPKEVFRTHQDILNSRTVTPNVSSTKFTVDKKCFHIFDVSGLKQDRMFWIQYFDIVDSVLFVLSLSCYDQTMVEDPTCNRMADSISLFNQIVDSPLLQHASLIIFLNKKDLYERKVKKIPIQTYFPDYTG